MEKALKLLALIVLGRDKQRAAALLLLNAAYVTWYCPCGRINGCHKGEFFLSTGVATAIVAHDNLR